MSKSAVTINYETRPCKFVERRMLVASLSRILGAIRNGQDYQYIGFGGCAFTDFKLFHRELQITKMISIEKEGYTDQKLELNKPFQCVSILRGESTDVLPRINFDIPSIIWLDYDTVLKKNMFLDIELIFHTVPAGSIFIFSCNQELKKCNYVELLDSYDIQDGNNPMSEEELRTVFEDLVPYHIEKDACATSNSHKTIKSMLEKKINASIKDRNSSKSENLKFELLYNIMYQEYRGAHMYTFGGIICDASKNIQNVYFDDFDFISRGSSTAAYKIDVPVLTHREALALNQILFNEEEEKKFIDNGILTQKELEKYKNIYKYCPSFHDVRI